MVFTEVLNTVKKADYIKKLKNEFYIYTPDRKFALVYHKDGQITKYLTDISGKKAYLTPSQKTQLQNAIDGYFKFNEVMNIVKNAKSIKRHEDSFYIYGYDNQFAMVCHTNNNVTDIVIDLKGTKIPLNNLQKTRLEMAIYLYFRQTHGYDISRMQQIKTK